MKAKKLFLAGALACSTLTAPMMTMLNATPVFAETITVKNEDGTASTRVYNAYKIFKGDITKATNDAPGTLSNIEWAEDVEGTKIIAKLVENKFPNVTEKTTAKELAALLTDANATQFSKALYDVLKAAKEGETPLGSVKGTTTNGTCGLDEAGYYLLVDTTDTTDTTDPNNPKPKDEFVGLAVLRIVGDDKEVAVKPKNGKPTVDKKVSDERDTNENVENREEKKPVLGQDGKVSYNETEFTADNDYGKSADHEIGEIFTFQLEAQLPTNENMKEYESYYLKFNDTLSKGLEFVGDDVLSIKVIYNTVGEGGVTTSNTMSIPADKYTLSERKTDTNGVTTFTIEIEDLVAVLPNGSAGLSGAKVEVVYAAKLTSDAVIDNSFANNNKVDLEYSNNPNEEGKGKTPEKHVFIGSYKVENLKTDGDKKDDKGNPIPLPEAGFKLQDTKTEKWATFAKPTTGDNAGKWVLTGWVDSKDDGTQFSSDAKGDFSVYGLDEGTYLMTETNVPAGYNKADDTTIVISSSHTTTAEPQTKDNVTVDLTMTANNQSALNGIKVPNYKGSTLPETGGMGTTMLYTAGGVLVAGAALFFVTNKRMKKEED